MKYLFYFALLILFFSCKSDRIESLQDVLEGMAPEEQETTIDPTKDNMLTGDKGTKVFIPANAFQFGDGSLPPGKVVVTMQEFVSVSDFISNNLSTLSDSFLLETGGMLFISATSGGKELELSKSKSYVVAFPNKDATKKMETFYGITNPAGQVNWTPAFSWGESSAGRSLDSTLLDSTMYKPKISVCGWGYSSWNNINSWRIKHKDSTLVSYIENNFPPLDQVTENALCMRGLRLEIQVSLNSRGKTIGVDLDKTHLHNYQDSLPISPFLRKLLSDFFISFPALEERTLSQINFEYGIHVILCCHTQIDWKEYDKRFKEKYSQYQDNAVQKMGSEALNYSVLSSSRLGWINCDRFLDDTTEKTDFIVNINGATGSLAFITFDDIKSIMRGEEKNGSFVFRNIPVNAKIKVIGIAYQEGKPLLSKMPANISKQPFTLSGFSEFSLNELEKQLNN